MQAHFQTHDSTKPILTTNPPTGGNPGGLVKKDKAMNEFSTKIPNSKGQSKPIYAGSRVVGQVIGNTFYKSVSSSKHFLRTPPAIAFDVATLAQAEEAGARKVCVTDKDTGNQYRASLEHIRLNGFTFNRGFGEQVGLVMDGWIKTRKGQPEQYSLLEGLK